MKKTEDRPVRGYSAPGNSGRILLADLLLFGLGFVLTAVITKGTWQFAVLLTGAEKAGMLLSCAFAVLFFRCFEMYSVTLFRPGPTVVTAVLSAVYTFCCTAAMLFRADILLFLALGNGIGYLLLCLWRIGLYGFCKNRTRRPRLLLVETSTEDKSRVKRIKNACQDRFEAWYEQVDTENPEQVQAFIEEKLPEYDAVCLTETVPLDIRNLFLEAGLRMNKEFYIVPAGYDMHFSGMELAYLDDVMVFHLRPAKISTFHLIVKRLLDIVLSSLGLLVAAAPMCLIAILIKFTSPGPVLYRQLRLTKDKKEFYIYKFRTMVQDAEKQTGPTLAARNDPRITGVGKWLRKSRLDELPQFINVLKGDMSLVGPRPERPFFVEQYEKEIPNYDTRFTVRAGLTALSHVYGRYSTDIADRTRYDLLYVQNYSLMLDLRIMLLTSRTLFLSDAAEGIRKADPAEAARNETN